MSGFNQQRSTLTTIVPVAAKRTPVDMLNNSKTLALDLTFKLHLSVTVAGTAVKNRGSAVACYDECGVLEAGKPVWLMDPRVLRHVAECAAPSGLSAVRATDAAVQETDLQETFRLYFADPLTAQPWETAFMEHNITLLLQFFAKLSADGASRIIEGGTAALTNPEIIVTQVHDESDTRLPLLRPTVEARELTVSGTSAALPLKIDVTDRLRGICISTFDSNGDEVNDVINAATLRGDRKFIIGDVPTPWDDLAREQESQFGGDVYAGPKGAHVYFNYQTFGRLANTLDPVKQDTNLRWLFDCQKSASGAGDSKIWMTLFKLEHDLKTGPDGRRVTDPNLPFA